MNLRDPGMDLVTADAPPFAVFTAPAPRPVAVPHRPTSAQIAGRARAIWETQECPIVRASENFRPAELELLSELYLPQN